MNRGTAVHKCIEYHETGVLNEESLDQQLAPYLDAWLAFKRDSGWAASLDPELLVAHAEMGYATAIDQCGRFPGSPRVWCLNIKTSKQPAWWWAIQSAGEARAFSRWFEDPVIPKRAALRLLPGSTPPYKLDVHEDRKDLAKWDSVVVVAAMREAHCG